MGATNNHIDYVEFTAHDLEAVKRFYETVFGWTFTDYGPAYTSFENSGIAGGFAISDKEPVNGALVVLYHHDLEQCLSSVTNAGGVIVRPIFSFPGGRRFHFRDPSGNELAVWSEPKE